MNKYSFLRPFTGMAGLPTQAESELDKILSQIDADSLADSFFDCRKEAVALSENNAPAARLGFFPEGFYPEHAFFSPAKKAFDAAHIDRNAGFLAVLIYFSVHTLDIYRAYGLPESVFAASLGEVGKAARAFYAKHGFYGAEDYVWLNCFLIPELFTVGSLQMRLCAFPYERFDTGFGILHQNDPVVQIHVPECADLSQSALEQSYRLAYSLFGVPYFFADSWLLYPPHREMLPPDSAIRGFMEDFSVIETDETHDYEGLWRIFGKQIDYRKASLPQKTSLQRAYAERVAKGLPIGSAVGIRYFKF